MSRRARLAAPATRVLQVGHLHLSGHDVLDLFIVVWTLFVVVYTDRMYLFCRSAVSHLSWKQCVPVHTVQKYFCHSFMNWYCDYSVCEIQTWLSLLWIFSIQAFITVNYHQVEKESSYLCKKKTKIMVISVASVELGKVLSEKHNLPFENSKIQMSDRCQNVSEQTCILLFIFNHEHVWPPFIKGLQSSWADCKISAASGSSYQFSGVFLFCFVCLFVLWHRAETWYKMTLKCISKVDFSL